MKARGRKAPKLAQITRWYAEYTAGVNDADPYEETFVGVRREFEKFAALVVRLRDALREPFKPGNAKIIAETETGAEFLQFCPEGLGDGTTDSSIAAGGTIGTMGEALLWGLAGADPDVLRKEAAQIDEYQEKRHAQEERAEEFRRQRCTRPMDATPDERDRDAADSVISTAINCTLASGIARSERLRIVQEVTQALTVEKLEPKRWDDILNG